MLDIDIWRAGEVNEEPPLVEGCCYDCSSCIHATEPSEGVYHCHNKIVEKVNAFNDMVLNKFSKGGGSYAQ